jgi:hypothetical protein
MTEPYGNQPTRYLGMEHRHQRRIMVGDGHPAGQARPLNLCLDTCIQLWSFARHSSNILSQVCGGKLQGSDM